MLNRNCIAKGFLIVALIWLPIKLLAAPQAGSVIGNQASATYTDSNGTSYSTTSNLVETIIQPVYGLSLVADHSTFVSAGSTAYFPHVLTNNGNTNDTFTLQLLNDAGDDFDFSNLGIYLDADRDGSPDNGQAITSISLNVGAEINLVVAATVSGLSAAGESGATTFTATSDGDPGQSDSVTDMATVRTGAVVQVTKSMSATSGSADTNAGDATPYTITLAYQNTGNAAATNLTIIDTLPVGMRYVEDSGLASVTAAQQLTDDSSAEPISNDGSVITYEYDSGNHEVTYTIDSAANSGYVRFQIYILTTDINGNPVSAGNVTNTASYSYDGQVSESTNSVQFTVSPETLVSLDALGTDTQTQASASQGATVSFTHTVANIGNIDDTFNLNFGSSSYPAGTAFKLFRSDGLTPLVDSNGDGIVDTGVLASGSSVDVVLKIYLPPDATGGPSQILLTAVSSIDSTVSDSIIDEITSITALTADLTANDTVAGGGDGIGLPGASGEGTPVGEQTVAPGSSVTVPLFINNQSGANDTYEVGVDNLPSGWQAEFFVDTNGNGIIDPGEPEFVNSGSVPGGTALALIAVVTVPEDESPGDQDLIFHVASPNTSASDYLNYRVTVDTIYALDVSPDNMAQASPGTSVVFPHRIHNTGNAASGDITLSLSHSNSQGWNGTIYLDDGATPGVLDSTDSVYNPASPPTLAADAQLNVFVQAIVPLSATAQAQDTIVLTASITPPTGTITGTATDVVTVITTEINLDKQQALDGDCNGVADTGFSNGEISSGAVPGACLIYRISANNTGGDAISLLVIHDTTPAFTTMESSALSTSVTVGGVNYTGAGDCGSVTRGVSSPVDDATGTITGFICDLGPAATGVLEFSVKIDP